MFRKAKYHEKGIKVCFKKHNNVKKGVKQYHWFVRRLLPDYNLNCRFYYFYNIRPYQSLCVTVHVWEVTRMTRFSTAKKDDSGNQLNSLLVLRSTGLHTRLTESLILKIDHQVLNYSSKKIFKLGSCTCMYDLGSTQILYLYMDNLNTQIYAWVTLLTHLNKKVPKLRQLAVSE